MIAHLKELEKKLHEVNLSKKQAATIIGMQPKTFMNKLSKPEFSFTLGEADCLAALTEMSECGVPLDFF